MLDHEPARPPSLQDVLQVKVGSQLTNFLIVVGLGVLAIHGSINAMAQDMDRRHRRAERLAACKRRRDWKVSDIPRLKTLGVSPAALKRMDRLTGRGRPVVKAHQPLEVALLANLRTVQILFDPKCSPTERKRAFRAYPWRDHHIEALYRGERDLARARGIASPADYSETIVGDALGISAAKVHAVCNKIRRMRQEWDGSANFPPMLLVDYERWMETGKADWMDVAVARRSH